MPWQARYDPQRFSPTMWSVAQSWSRPATEVATKESGVLKLPCLYRINLLAMTAICVADTHQGASCSLTVGVVDWQA